MCVAGLSGGQGVWGAEAGDAYSLKLWTVEDRLPGSPVVGVAQADDGYLWLVTGSQLIRFNGIDFYEIAPPRDVLTRTGALAGVFCGRSPGAVWVWGARGVALRDGAGWQVWPAERDAGPGGGIGRILGLWQRLDGAVCAFAERGLLEPVQGDGKIRFVVKRCPVPSDDRATLGAVTGASADGEGRLWMTAWNGLVEYWGGKFDDQSMRLPDFLVEAASGVYAGRSGRLWVYGTTGVAYREAGDIWTPIGFPENAGMANGMLEVSDGSLWLGNPTGLFRWQGSWRRVAGQDAPGSLSVNGLIEDREGTIWAACDGGLLRIRRKNVERLPAGEAATAGTAYSAFWPRPSNGSVWVGYKGRAVRLKEADGRLLQTVYLDTDVPVSAITQEAGGRVWFGTLGGGLFVQSGGTATLVTQSDYSMPAVHTVYALAEVEGFGVLAGTPQGLMRVNPGGELEPAAVYGTRVAESVHALMRDTDGALWICCEQGGVLRVSPDGGKLQIGAEAGLAGFPRAVFRDSGGHLWVGTTSGLFGVTQDAVVPMGRAAGVFDDAVLQIAEDAKGRLWLGTQNGLRCVPIDELLNLMRGDAGENVIGVRSLRWSREDGLPGERCMGGVVSATYPGRIWFTFENGIAVVDPGRAVFSERPPTVAIERVTADGRLMLDNAFAQAGGLVFPPGARNIVFTFSALSPGTPESIRFRCRVEGLRKGWSPVQNERTAVFPALPPGSYTLRVVAEAGGVWNAEGACCPFTVRAYYWQTPWFYLALAGLLAVTVFLFARGILWHRYRLQMEVLKREEALSQERARISRDIHDDLGNGLSVVATLSELAHHDVEKEAAHKRLDQIYDVANELARNVDEIVWAVNPANDGWEPFISYFEQYTEYFLGNSGLRFHFTRPPDLTAREIAAKTRHHLLLAVREAVANVLKHAAAKQVSIAMQVAGNELTVTVEDDGVGFDTSRVAGIGHDGLGNMARRMREAGGSVAFDSKPGRGTRVTFRVPVGVLRKDKP
jgi:signal transduction histidine kinase/ligand-binding sensor domain-containing protein